MSADRWHVHTLKGGRGTEGQEWSRIVWAVKAYGQAYVETATGCMRVYEDRGTAAWERCERPTPLVKERALRREEERPRR